jgi:hypothetical protein
MNDKSNTPTFRRPTEEEKGEVDPFADQKAFFAYWEAKRITDEMNRHRDFDSLSIYERSRLRDR